jgi:PilZ domain
MARRNGLLSASTKEGLTGGGMMDFAARNQSVPNFIGEDVDTKSLTAARDTPEPRLSGAKHSVPNGPESANCDRATRYTLFIRAAKLVTSQGEFVCIVRDVSETGIRLRLFHAPPTGEPIELHMSNGRSFILRQIWHKNNEAGYAFAQRIEISEFVVDKESFPKRGLRLNLTFPVQVRSLDGQHEGIIENISQQGARLSCSGLYAIDQALRLECPEEEIQFGEVNAKVRWRREDAYGLVFENTLSLEEFAMLAARLQCPRLLP